jgi:hypothetical protein
MFLSWYKQNCEIIPTSASSLLTNIIHTRQQELPDVGFRWPHRLGPRTILQWTHSHLDISSGDTASLFSKECGTAWSFLPSSVGHFQPDGVGIPHETNRAFTEFPLLEGLPLVPLDFHPKPEKNDPSHGTLCSQITWTLGKNDCYDTVLCQVPIVYLKTGDRSSQWKVFRFRYPPRLQYTPTLGVKMNLLFFITSMLPPSISG